jgi:iron-sulfur cluster assembly protein
MGVTLTAQAADHIDKYLQKRGKGIGLRLGVRTTGCSGMAYKLEYVDELAKEDQVFESFGVKVFIDPKSLVYLQGTELDYAREGLNEGFKFLNPNEKATCGCGESFTV